jgi:uncharacterized protein YjiK
MRKITRIFLISIITVVLAIFIYSFIKPAEKQIISGISYNHQAVPYDLANPSRSLVLPIELKEISGIAYYKKNQLACIEDEWGAIYLYDYSSNQIIARYNFAKAGDYEDITIVDTMVYALRSNGRIYRIKNLGLEKQKDKHYKTILSGRNDSEGICYDADRKALLIACKGSPRLSASHIPPDEKAIFAFDLDSKDILLPPAYTLDFMTIRNLTGTAINHEAFQPSGIAIHPQSGHIYLISSVGKLLMVLDSGGQVLAIVPLKPRLFKQPEGICFSPEGTLFISNEGRNGKGDILMFD